MCLCGDRLEMRAALGPFIATVPLCWRLLSSAHVMSYSRMDKEMPISKAVPSSWLRFFCLPFWLEPNYRLLPQRFVYGSLIRRQLGRLIKSFCCWITRRDRCIRHFFLTFFEQIKERDSRPLQLLQVDKITADVHTLSVTWLLRFECQ